MDSDTEAAEVGVGDHGVGRTDHFNEAGPSGVGRDGVEVPDVGAERESEPFIPTSRDDDGYFSEEEVILEGELSNEQVDDRTYP